MLYTLRYETLHLTPRFDDTGVSILVDEWLQKECGFDILREVTPTDEIVKRFATMVAMIVEHGESLDPVTELNNCVIEHSTGEVRYYSITGFKNSIAAYFFEHKQDAVHVKMKLGGLVFNTPEYV